MNALRKTAKLTPADQIIVYVAAKTIAAQIIERYSQDFLRDVRAKAATPSLTGATHTSELKLNGQSNTIGLSRA